MFCMLLHPPTQYVCRKCHQIQNQWRPIHCRYWVLDDTEKEDCNCGCVRASRTTKHGHKKWVRLTYAACGTDAATQTLCGFRWYKMYGEKRPQFVDATNGSNVDATSCSIAGCLKPNQRSPTSFTNIVYSLEYNNNNILERITLIEQATNQAELVLWVC